MKHKNLSLFFNWEEIPMKIMKDFFNAVLNVFLFPFQLISVIVNEINDYLQHINQNIQNKKIKKKQQNKFDELKCVLLGHNQTKINHILHIFILLATTGLQFISLFTTYAGTNYYFGNVTQPKFLGPLILSCVIQFSLLFLSNTLVQQERTNKGSKCMLVFFLCISILFSYAGMIHTLVPPYKEMKSNYEDFMNKYDILRYLIPFWEVCQGRAEFFTKDSHLSYSALR